MANFATLKAAITAAIKQNGNNEITGNLLQQQLLAMVNSLGVGYQYAGIATPATNPGTPDQNVFYIASTAGTYTNFNGLVLTDGEIAILKYNGAWAKDSTGAATKESVNQLGQKVCDIYFSDYTFPKFSNNGTSVDITFTGDVLLIYNNESNVIINTGTHTFTLSNAQKLVYLNNALTVESVTTLDNGIVIAINSGGSISGGLLAPYYAAYDNKNKDYTIIFSDSIYPNVAKSGTDLAVSFTTATNILIRQSNGEMLIIAHGAESFTIAKNQKLVYDTTLKVVAYNVDNNIVLAVNNGDGYFTSGLLADALNAVISKDGDFDLMNKAFSIFYSDSSYPTVSSSGDSLIVSFASSSTIGFYQNNGKRLLMSHGADSFTIGKNQKLVYDSILKVVAYDYTAGIVLAYNGGDGYFTGGLLADSLNALISRNIGQSEYLGDFCDNVISVARCGYNISSLTTPPEQTIASYKEAYKNKYRYMLADVQFTSDHVPVALHDETINSVARNADGTTISDPVYLADLTLEQVDEYDFGIIKGSQYAGTKIMRIDDFIKWCKMANCVPILEVKTFLPNRQDANFLALAAIIKKYAMGEKIIFEADAGHTTAVTLHEEFPLAEIGRTCTANTDFSALVTQTLAVKGDNKVFWYLYLGNQTTGQISNNMISLATANGISIGCSELFTESDLNSFLTDANNLICEKIAIRNHPVSYYMI